MPFTDDRQTARACMVLTNSLGLCEMWNEDGPTHCALDRLKNGGGHLSSGQALMLRVAFAFWNGHRGATLERMLAVFDGQSLELVCSLMIAAERSEVDAWLAKHEGR